MSTIDKHSMQVKQLIFHNLMQIVELFPQYTVAQHLYHIMRKKGDTQDVYYWKDEKMLKKFEDYKDELETELATLSIEEANDNY